MKNLNNHKNQTNHSADKKGNCVYRKYDTANGKQSESEFSRLEDEQDKIMSRIKSCKSINPVNPDADKKKRNYE